MPMKSRVAGIPIYLDRNENNYGPAPACFDVLRRIDSSVMSFYTKVHTRGVKSIITERLAREYDVPETSILLGYGAEDLLKQAVACFLRAGGRLMIPSHSWWYYKAIAGEVGGKNVEYPLIRGKNAFAYDIDEMLRVYARERPDMVFVSSPNNPTGNAMSPEDADSFLNAVRDVPVVFDEAYWFDGQPLQIRRLLELHPNMLIVRTFSKYYALAGVRIGFAFIGDRLKRMEKMSHRYLGFNRMSEEVAVAALDSSEYYTRIARTMREDRDLYYTTLGALPGVTVFRSEANFVLVEIPGNMPGPLKEFLTARGIIVKFMDEQLLNSHVRITLGTREQNLLVIDAIREFFGEGEPHSPQHPAGDNPRSDAR
jgi:histidinol-phosphate aminotransferase